MTFEQMWQSVLAEIELQISRANFITWFKNTGILDKKDGVITVYVPNNFSKEWLENKYNKHILRALRNIDSDIKEVSYIIRSENDNTATMLGIKKRKIDRAVFEEQMEFGELEINQETNLNPRYTFKNFIVGPSNELAHAAAMAVVHNPGTKYNPLFIYGGTGLGKTHLVQAIGNEIIKLDKTKNVKYVSSEKFVSEVVTAIRNQSMEELKNNYRKNDILIIDDIQFIAGKEKCQEEFVNTFNSLYENNKQIILSSDRPPKSISAVEERVRSRWEGGMIADIGYPEFETRVAILKSKLQEKNYSLPDEILNYVANNIQKNIRELEGALNRIIAASRLTGGIITINEAEKILSQIITGPKKTVNFKHLIKVVSDFYDISEKDLLTRCRRKEIVKPRQIAMYLLRSELKNSFPYIGSKLGGRDHTTAIHACAKIEKEIRTDKNLLDEINLIKEKLYNTV